MPNKMENENIVKAGIGVLIIKDDQISVK